MAEDQLAGVQIARCPVHGLHGQREDCHECGGPVDQVAMVEASKAARITAMEIRVIEGNVVLVCEFADGRAPAVGVMSPRECHHLRSRMHKAANDAASQAARLGAST